MTLGERVDRLIDAHKQEIVAEAGELVAYQYDPAMREATVEAIIAAAMSLGALEEEIERDIDYYDPSEGENDGIC